MRIDAITLETNNLSRLETCREKKINEKIDLESETKKSMNLNAGIMGC